MIELKNLCFAYNKGPMFLKNVSFSVKTGHCLLLLGGQGMGKTTILRLISGLEKQYAGKILINGRDMEGANVQERNISYLPSQPVLFENKTVQQNIDYLLKTNGIDIKPAELEAALKEFGLLDKLGQKVQKLSLKDKKLLAMARSYIKNAQILLIDDQCQGEDDEACSVLKNAILTLIKRKNGSKTAICVCESEKSLIQGGELMYLSYSKCYLLESIEKLKQDAYDAFALSYGKSTSWQFMLERNSGYSLLEIAPPSAKNKKLKKGEEREPIKSYRLSPKYFDKLDELKLLEHEQVRVVLAVWGDAAGAQLGDAQIDKLLSGGANLFVFGTGEKII